jgi:hypothetical protein
MEHSFFGFDELPPKIGVLAIESEDESAVEQYSSIFVVRL